MELKEEFRWKVVNENANIVVAKFYSRTDAEMYMKRLQETMNVAGVKLVEIK